MRTGCYYIFFQKLSALNAEQAMPTKKQRMVEHFVIIYSCDTNFAVNCFKMLIV